jgi:hypothetical protein
MILRRASRAVPGLASVRFQRIELVEYLVVSSRRCSGYVCEAPGTNRARLKSDKGIKIPIDELLFPAHLFQALDLTKSFQLNRRFELILCLEVAEHLSPNAADGLIDSLIAHGDTILFNAACPGQPGQHHINCRWPSYWQDLFNRRNYACDDSIRWQLESDTRIEPWCRQNIFVARHRPDIAGKEQRIISVVHPDMMPIMTGQSRYLPQAGRTLFGGSAQWSAFKPLIR